MQNHIVSGIFIYPVKGLKGISVDNAQCTQLGFRYDRMWMIVDETSNFISQRTDKKMALISTAITGDHITLTYGSESLKLPVSIPNGEELQVTVWDDTCTALVADEPYNAWISAVLGKSCRFVYMAPRHNRQADTRFAKYGEAVSFADGFPYLIIGESALQHLNTKLDTPIRMDRFRPNIVFAGGAPHAEDDWREFSIGNVDFYGEKPCARCKVTTIDQQTGEQGKEPLQTLSTYRQFNNKILFGLNILAKNEGTIKVGDFITLK